MDHEGHSSLNQTGAETVYGTHEDNTMVMSEKVRGQLLFVQLMQITACVVAFEPNPHHQPPRKSPI